MPPTQERRRERDREIGSKLLQEGRKGNYFLSVNFIIPDKKSLKASAKSPLYFSRLVLSSGGYILRKFPYIIKKKESKSFINRKWKELMVERKERSNEKNRGMQCAIFPCKPALLINLKIWSLLKTETSASFFSE